MANEEGVDLSRQMDEQPHAFERTTQIIEELSAQSQREPVLKTVAPLLIGSGQR